MLGGALERKWEQGGAQGAMAPFDGPGTQDPDLTDPDQTED
jgi:hypothetical protein